MTRFSSIAALALVLAGCAKPESGGPAPADAVSHFVAGYTNLQGSFIYSSLGVPSSASPKEALAKLSADGSLRPRGITKFDVVEIRIVHPHEPELARRLTNSAIALIATATGQKIVHLRQLSGEWCYHLYDTE